MIADATLKQVPLHEVHLQLGAKMVPFAGYSMPVQYKAGVLKEHQFTRTSAGLFDVSHMGQIVVRPRSGKLADAALGLERIVPADIVALGIGRQRYTQFTIAGGGISDDLMIANFGTHYLLVVKMHRVRQTTKCCFRAALGIQLRNRHIRRSSLDRITSDRTPKKFCCHWPPRSRA